MRIYIANYRRAKPVVTAKKFERIEGNGLVVISEFSPANSNQSSDESGWKRVDTVEELIYAANHGSVGWYKTSTGGGRRELYIAVSDKIIADLELQYITVC